MRFYKIIVQRTIVSAAAVTFEALTAEEARRKSLKHCREYPHAFATLSDKSAVVKTIRLDH